MLFDTALTLIRGGHATSRESWTDGAISLDPMDSTNILLTASTGVTSWAPVNADLLATDWQPGDAVVVPADPAPVDTTPVDPAPAPTTSKKSK